MILEIRNTTDNKVVLLAPVQDAGTSRLHYTLGITLPEGILNGEYEYILREGNAILSTGLLRIGAYGKAGGEYDEPISYTQYGE